MLQTSIIMRNEIYGKIFHVCHIISSFNGKNLSGKERTNILSFDERLRMSWPREYGSWNISEPLHRNTMFALFNWPQPPQVRIIWTFSTSLKIEPLNVRNNAFSLMQKEKRKCKEFLNFHFIFITWIFIFSC